jgi:hypothetical protein
MLYCHDKPSEPTKDPFRMYSLSPHLPQFQQSEGTTPLKSIWSVLNANIQLKGMV